MRALLIVSVIIFISYLGLSLVSSTDTDAYKLEQLQVLFRHCERTPNDHGDYLARAYSLITQQYGLGQITQLGKERQYKIGRMLRQRYDDFLGEYRNEEVFAYSTDMDRTKQSLLLMLAGLYPPTASTAWSKSIDWQPIPTHYEAWNTSFLSAAFSCPAYNDIYHNLPEVVEVSEVIKKYEESLNDVDNSTNIRISSAKNTWSFYMLLRGLLSLNMPLPSNLTMEDFYAVEKATAVCFKALSSNESLRRMMAGPMVERFLRNFKEAEDPKKVYLYSASEFNIAAFIDSHNITGAPGIHDYGSALILERLRGPDDRSYIRVYLWTGVSEQWLFLKIDNCKQTCLLSDYEKLVQPILPDEASKVCYSSSDGCGS